MNVELYILHRI